VGKVLILGGTGKLGKVLVSYFLLKKYEVVVLVRNPDKINIKNASLKIIKGNVTNVSDLKKSLEGVRFVISALGHGFRTTYPILEKNLETLIPLLEEKNIIRLITVTGAGMKTEEDKNSFFLSVSEMILNIIDPFRLSDARKQQILLETSGLNWTVVRTPVHKTGNKIKIKSVGYNQPKFWYRITRISIANFIYICIKEDKWIKKSPVIY
jgi:putative NADH-flavin reductase